ncbi:hypothetical protein [Bacillus taeanensis]|uniref:Group-specific protein n=1 Tax=Bacillus taeanensis TaxID=273032 RepID=A0A366XM75_9BACI|nr:hypothetical protein [Bacillus taeanensis]RBW67460.1 hypothetical protein DS031_22255 [Bacillus taeanensis]
MKLAFVLVTIICVGALLGTIAVAKTVDTNYGKSTKKNLSRLSVIYVFLILFLLIGVGWFAFANL